MNDLIYKCKCGSLDIHIIDYGESDNVVECLKCSRIYIVIIPTHEDERDIEVVAQGELGQLQEA